MQMQTYFKPIFVELPYLLVYLLNRRVCSLGFNHLQLSRLYKSHKPRI